MQKFRTIASEAQNVVDQILPKSDFVNKPWQLLGHRLESRILDATEDELIKLLNIDASARPGYEKTEDIVFVPNLFVKLSGVSKTSNFLLDDFEFPQAIVYNSLGQFSENAEEAFDTEGVKQLFNENGLVDRNKLFNSPIYQFTFLRIEYQNLLVDKINFILQNRSNIFSERVDLDPVKIVAGLLKADIKLFELFNEYDFQFTVPKIVIMNNLRESFSHKQAYILSLLALLGFDVVIVSTKGFSDVENVLTQNFFKTYYSQPEKQKKKNRIRILLQQLSQRKTAIITALIIIFTLGTAVFYTNYQNISAVSQETQIIQQDEVNILSITPQGPLKEGVETEFNIQVKYHTNKFKEAKLSVGANDMRGNHYFRFSKNAETDQFFYEKASVFLTNASGKCNFIIKAVPKKWENNEFKISVAIIDPVQHIFITHQEITLPLEKSQ